MFASSRSFRICFYFSNMTSGWSNTTMKRYAKNQCFLLFCISKLSSTMILLAHTKKCAKTDEKVQFLINLLLFPSNLRLLFFLLISVLSRLFKGPEKNCTTNLSTCKKSTRKNLQIIFQQWKLSAKTEK